MLEQVIFRDPLPGQPRVIAAFSFRHDAHLVPGYIENIRPGVHGYVAWDDRTADHALSDEPTRRMTLVKAALALGADWLLTADPDERFEGGIADWLPELVAYGDRVLWQFAVREMFGPTAYRIDGLWSSRPRLRLFPAGVASVDPAVALHGSWVEETAGLLRRTSGLNLYHLRMATPARRKLRRDLYAAADPDRRFQPIGYDYLADERGMLLETIPEGRGFTPAFVEDHGLWSPDPGAIGPIVPDPYTVRFARAAASARHLGQMAACHVMQDLHLESPQDADLGLLAGRYALLAADYGSALAISEGLLRDAPRDLSARLLQAEVCIAQGRDAADDLAALLHAAPGSPMVSAQLADAFRATTDFAATDADWRQAAPANAMLREGPGIARADLAVVVIGFRGQPGLLPAVRSILDQDAAAEIVVVNTGGGDVVRQLAPVLDHIRLITSDDPCQVGAARNIGVKASRARYIAFLAGDCLARPGWVTARLERHRAGAAAVSSAVVTREGADLLSLAANRLHYATRHPMTREQDVSHYGQSYDRSLLRRCGIFPPGLPSGEDTRLNRVARTFALPVWAADVQTVHHEPPTLRDWLLDECSRGRRQAIHPPFRALARTDAGDCSSDAASHAALDAVSGFRLRQAHRLILTEPGLSPAERRAVLATLWLASRAARRGVITGIGDIAAANRLTAEAKAAMDRPAAAVALLSAARVIDPHDPEKALLAGKALQSLGRMPEAEEQLRQTLALLPSHVEAVDLLTGLVAARDGARAAWHRAERIALDAPTSPGLWSVAASRALAAGQANWAVVLGRIALGCAPDRPYLHRQLGRYHEAAGNPVLAAFRRMTARRLSQAASDEGT